MQAVYDLLKPAARPGRRTFTFVAFVCSLLRCEGAPIPGGNGAGSLYDVELYDIDYSYSSAVIADLQGKGKKVMCYVSAGTSEEFRDDINLFPADVQGGIVSFGEGDTVSLPHSCWRRIPRILWVCCRKCCMLKGFF